MDYGYIYLKLKHYQIAEEIIYNDIQGTRNNSS